MQLWQAFLVNTSASSEAAELGKEAAERLLYHYAVPLLRAGAQAGNERARARLIEILVKTGDLVGLREHVRPGMRSAFELINLLWQSGNHEEAIATLREWIKVGVHGAALRLSRILLTGGDTDAAIAAL